MSNLSPGVPVPQQSKARILVVDDNPKIRTPLAAILRRSGYEVDTAASAYELRRQLDDPRHDVLVLDVMLPDGDGFQLCATLARTQPDLPVILLTARGEHEDRVRGLQLGADDYVTKPFAPDELLARIAAVLRRCQRGPRQTPAAAAASARLHFDGLVYLKDYAQVVLADQRRVQLTAAEAALLEAFLARPRQTLSRDWLVQALKLPGEEADERLIDRRVSRLRRKLWAACDRHGPAPLRTLWGQGYALNADVGCAP